jgi:hypothetical protein
MYTRSWSKVWAVRGLEDVTSGEAGQGQCTDGCRILNRYCSGYACDRCETSRCSQSVGRTQLRAGIGWRQERERGGKGDAHQWRGSYEKYALEPSRSGMAAPTIVRRRVSNETGSDGDDAAHNGGQAHPTCSLSPASRRISAASLASQKYPQDASCRLW